MSTPIPQIGAITAKGGWVTATLAVATAIVVRRTRFGLALVGIGADEQRAQTLGVPTRWVKTGGFILTAAFAGAARFSGTTA